MKQVTREQFYVHVGDKDAITDVRSADPEIWYKMRHSARIIGKVVESPVYWEAACGYNNAYFIMLDNY